MGRRSMEELLNAFDPLHSSNGLAATSSSAPPPLFPTGNTTSSATSASPSSSNNNSKSAPADLGHVATSARHNPVSLSSAPLDLLSFDDNEETSAVGTSSRSHQAISSSRNGGQSDQSSSITSKIQDRASKRQDDILGGLHNADQTFEIPSMQNSTATSASPPSTTRPTPRQRRPSSGFSPPRRMSKSGLMHDDQQTSQIRSSSSIPGPGEPHSPTLEILGHAPPTPSTQISEEPAVLFHPSSPPAGSTIESLRQKKGYFPPPPPPVQSIFDRPVATSDRQRRTSSSDRQAFHTLNDGSTSSQPHAGSATATNNSQARKPSSGSRAAFIQNALRGPPPPFSSPTLKQSTSSHPQPIPGPSTAPTCGAPKNSVSPSSPVTKTKLSRKPTFDFPLFSSLNSSVSSDSYKSHSLPPPPSSAAATTQIKDGRGSGSNTPSPASSLIIDSDPLPSLVLKVTGAARDSRRVLTEDIADGVSPYILQAVHLPFD